MTDILTWVNGAWHEGNTPVAGPRSNGLWLAATAFDGARAFDGVCPDLDRHAARLVESARLLGLTPVLTGPEIEELAWEGVRRFPPGTELYISPMVFADGGFVVPDPDSTRFAMSLYRLPLPRPGDGFSACLSSYRRPALDMAPTRAKASCLYPNVARVEREARERGFGTAVVRDANGAVAEFAHTNLFLVKAGVVYTPAINGTFLNGITRRRVIQLLREDGYTVEETTLLPEDLATADELFATGNYAKVMPCRQYEDRVFDGAPVADRARRLYWHFARTGHGQPL